MIQAEELRYLCRGQVELYGNIAPMIFAPQLYIDGSSHSRVDQGLGFEILGFTVAARKSSLACDLFCRSLLFWGEARGSHTLMIHADADIHKGGFCTLKDGPASISRESDENIA